MVVYFYLVGPPEVKAGIIVINPRPPPPLQAWCGRTHHRSSLYSGRFTWGPDNTCPWTPGVQSMPFLVKAEETQQNPTAATSQVQPVSPSTWLLYGPPTARLQRLHRRSVRCRIELIHHRQVVVFGRPFCHKSSLALAAKTNRIFLLVFLIFRLLLSSSFFQPISDWPQAEQLKNIHSRLVLHTSCWALHLTQIATCCSFIEWQNTIF